jgi:hypothetical protein
MKSKSKGILLTAIGIALCIFAVTLALPVFIFCAVAQITFLAAIFVLDLITPSALTVLAFDLGSGFLNTGVGATIGFILLIIRKFIDIIKWAYLPANILFFVLTLGVAIQDYRKTTTTLLAAPGQAWAYLENNSVVKGIFGTLVFIALIWLFIDGVVEQRKIKRAVQNGTYVRKFKVPSWLDWAKVENVYGTQSTQDGVKKHNPEIE